ncbi:hypothetical protein THAOC_36197 [Thalassiosira oceanica]|uniref:Uncharacterized protein n=1 Tax=Thalassiosira oceanica TaxID=159749 RepID=K0R275_THAOC|nr:hypothetical protein THAOC_36197 [Thalassiosira oceanica]|eukprot:EJK45199.1 hypothetical protein THAOC_36197 [Thalassiosira oceanica]
MVPSGVPPATTATTATHATNCVEQECVQAEREPAAFPRLANPRLVPLRGIHIRSRNVSRIVSPAEATATALPRTHAVTGPLWERVRGHRASIDTALPLAAWHESPDDSRSKNAAAFSRNAQSDETGTWEGRRLYREVCREKDAARHAFGCARVQALSRELDRSATSLEEFVDRGVLPFMRANGFQAIFDIDNENFGRWSWFLNLNQSDKKLLIDTRKRVFNKKFELVQALVQESCRKDDRANEIAFYLAIQSCKDLLHLNYCGDCSQRSMSLILNTLLFSGQIEEHVNYSCYFLRNGHSDMIYAKLNDILKGKTIDVTKSCFSTERNGLCEPVNAHDEPDVSVCHLYLAKYLLHMRMENLRIIDSYLNNQDCAELIGEYAGMSEKTIIWKPGFYLHQAIDTLRYFHCQEINTCTRKNHFQGIEIFADDVVKNQDYFVGRLVKDGINFARGWLSRMIHRKNKNLALPLPQVIEDYTADYNLQYNLFIKPVLPFLVEKINSFAGSQIIGMAHTTSITRLLLEGTQCCYKRGFFFSDLCEYMDDYNGDCYWPCYCDGTTYIGESPIDLEGRFRDTVMALMFAEQKLAQANFYLYRNSQASKAILNKLPPNARVGSISAAAKGEYDGDLYDLSEMSTLLPDITSVVDALFYSGMASTENLTTIFGKADYVSLWAEGCLDNDKRKGLKIRYLSKDDRREKFREMVRLVPILALSRNLAPSVTQFVSTFGVDALGLPQFERQKLERASLLGKLHVDRQLRSKRPRSALDEFDNVGLACRRLFNASSFEEALWDSCSVPRSIVRNGTEELMIKAGWKYLDERVELNDSSVELGRRIAHVYSESWCSVWAES